VYLKHLKIFVVSAALFLTATANTENLKMQAVSPSPTMFALLDEAKKMMRFTGNISMPKLYSMNEKDLQKHYCEGAPKCDTVTAIYKDGAIYFDEDYDAKHPVWRSILFHEMVHHVQYVRQGGTKTCDDWYKREREAYDLQASYLRKQASSDKTVVDAAKTITCPP
jgi:hypothetical protein